MSGEQTTAQQPRHSEHVGDFDAVLWGVEKDPQLRNTITAVFVLDGLPDRATVLERFERLSRSIPGYRHRLVTPPLRLATPRWVVDPDFDLSYHVRWIGAPQPRTLDTVLEYARQSTMSGLDRDRPLWTVTVVDGLEGDRAALIIKQHHVLNDALGGMSLLTMLADLTREPRDLGPMPPPPEADSMNRPALVRDAIETNLDRMKGFVRDSGAFAVRNAPQVLRHPASSFNTLAQNMRALGRILTPASHALSPIMVERHGWARFAVIEVDLARLRRSAKSHAATVNDAFVTAIAMGFALYHEQHEAPVEQLRATVVISTRRPGDAPTGNHVSGGFLVLPVGTDDPAKYMAQYHDLITVARDDAQRPLAGAMGTALNGLGPLVSGYFGAMMKHCDFVTSNVPGINVPIYMGRAEVLAMYGFGPGMGTSANITLLSYNGTASVGLNVDAAAVPDVEVLVDCVRQGFDAVLALAD